MALEGTVKVPVFGTMKKSTAAAAGIGAVVLVLAVSWYRSHKASTAPAAAATAQVTDPAGNVCSAVNPATGYCPGTPADTAALQQASGAFTPYLGGGGSPYGYTTGQPITTTTAFATNAAWAQAAETYLQSNGADAIAAALSKYIAGQQMTTDQQTIVQEAIAAEGYPPVAGANGYPPSMQVVGTTGSSGKQVTVPNVVGQSYVQALQTLSEAGLAGYAHNTPAGTGGDVYVTATNPAAGQTVTYETPISCVLGRR